MADVTLFPLPAPDWALIDAAAEDWERKIAHERAQFPPRLRVV